MGDSPRIDLDHLGFIGTVEFPAEEELLTNLDVPVFHGLTITFLDRTLHFWGNFDDDDVTAFQGLGGLPEGLGNLDGIVGWIHGKELLGVFWGHCGDLFGQRPKA
jgi:hypothetical protein